MAPDLHRAPSPPAPRARPRRPARLPVTRRRLWIAIGALIALLAATALALVISGALSSGPQVRPLRPVSSVHVVESSSPVEDATGQRWRPDPYSQGGSLLTENVPISNTWSPSLYRTERVGVRSIEVPMRSEGPYLVVLYFAETAGARPHQRTFDVIGDGRRVASVDIAAEVGALMPYHVAFTTSAPHDRLSIRFAALKGSPVLSAMRIAPVSPGVHMPAAKLVWSDGFDGPKGSPPDPARWGYDLGHGWGQDARYTSAAGNASLDGKGDLVLAALPEKGRPGQYTSARLTTRQTFSTGYGTVSARIEVAAQAGVVSTFWALGSNASGASWPFAGEIDPAEVRGRQPRILIQAIHTHCGQRPCPVVWGRATESALSSGFHTFAVERAPGVLVYLLDGRQTASLTSADLPRGSWEFDKPFYLLLNLIVGGWGGSPSKIAHWPIEMRVDWVRVFR